MADLEQFLAGRFPPGPASLLASIERQIGDLRAALRRPARIRMRAGDADRVLDYYLRYCGPDVLMGQSYRGIRIVIDNDVAWPVVDAEHELSAWSEWQGRPLYSRGCLRCGKTALVLKQPTDLMPDPFQRRKALQYGQERATAELLDQPCTLLPG